MINFIIPVRIDVELPEPSVDNIETPDVGYRHVRTMHNNTRISSGRRSLLSDLVVELELKQSRVLVCWPAP